VRRKAIFAAFATRSSLWLGNDHLLSVDSTGYTEEYKRFYFRDIQVVTIRKTKRRVVWNWVLGTAIVLCLPGLATVLFSDARSEMGAFVMWGIFASLFAVPLLINNILGPTCACQLRTAVQIEELPSLCRVRRARKVLNRIRPLIAAVQGQLAPEEIPARMRELVESPATPGGAPAEPARYVVDDPNAPPRMVP
jgi:hypothetical protein